MRFGTGAQERPPAIPFDVEVYIEAELGRHQLSKNEGAATPAAIEDAPLSGEQDQRSDRLDLMTGAATLILQDLKEHLYAVDDDTTGLPLEECRQRAYRSRLFAGLLSTGLEIIEWLEDSTEQREWQTDAHAICGGIAFKVADDLNGLHHVTALAAHLGDHAAGVAPILGDN
jgi:hypothetical protein